MKKNKKNGDPEFFRRLRKGLLIMKCFLLLMFLSVLSSTASVYSQNKRFNMKEESITIKEVFEKIEEQSRFRFFYEEGKLNVLERRNVNFQNSAIDEVLNSLFDKSAVNYKILENDFVILKANPESQYTYASQDQQNRKVSGKVTDNSGTPLPGVTVIIKGTIQGTITNADGEYSLTDIPTDAILQFSFVGMQPQEIVVGSQSNIDVVLEAGVIGIDEVVAIGYGTQKKETVTGAISSISAGDINRSQSPNTSGALVGKIQGVNTRKTDGRPGATTSLQIRNMGTPLYVIDGVQKEESHFNNLNFNDIESISVLKDASAALYGVRAANGVVVVTTKKGKRNTPNRINVNASYGVQSMFRFPKPANAETYVASYIQSDAILGATNPTYTLEDLEKWRAGTEYGYRQFDWYDFVSQSAPQNYVEVNSSGGSDKINYYFAVSNLNQKANIVNYGGFNRTNVQFNIEANISDKLKVGADMNGRIEKTKHPGVPGWDDTWEALAAIYRNLPTMRPFANDNTNYPTLTSRNGSSNFAMLNYERSGIYEDLRRVIQLNFNAEYEIMDGLKFKGLFSYYFAHQWMDNHEFTYELYGYDQVTDTYPVIYTMGNPFRERSISDVTEIMSQVQINYKKQFGKHFIQAMIAAESYERENPNVYVHSLPETNAIRLINFPTLDTYNDTGKETQTRLGYIGHFTYDYDQKYLFDFSSRYDGSWKFPKDDRWGFFPSASVGWRVSREDFWDSSAISKTLTSLKLRASYGLLGDDNISGYNSFDYLNGYNYGTSGSVLGGTYVTGSTPRDLAVTSISWIRAKIFDVGFDFGFINNKLSGSIDYFVRNRTGLPDRRYDVLIPSEAGFSLPNENLNSDKNTGIDGILRWTDNIGDLGYSIGANMTYARRYSWQQYKPRFGNSVDEYINSDTERYESTDWLYHYIGQFQSWEEIANHPVDIDGEGNATMRPGDLIYEDVNGDGLINDQDRRPLAYPRGSTPILNFGINLAANWKGIDFAVDFVGAGAYSYFYEHESRYPFHDGGNSPQYVLEDQWHLSVLNDPNSELIPGKYPTVIVGNRDHPNYENSDFWSVNGRYLKLKNLEIGYTLPSSWVSKVGISKTRVSFNGMNLFSLDNFNKEVDPEITAGSGINYPTNRVYSVGINVEF